MKYQPFSAVYDHSCNLDSTFLLVAMYKSICICGCQWGVYASTWPIKEKKKVVSCAARPLTLRVASQVVSCAARPLTLRVASGYRGGVFFDLTRD